MVSRGGGSAFGEDGVAAGGADEADVDVERGLIDAAGGGRAVGAERAADGGVDQRGETPPCTGRAGRVCASRRGPGTVPPPMLVPVSRFAAPPSPDAGTSSSQRAGQSRVEPSAPVSSAESGRLARPARASAAPRGHSRAPPTLDVRRRRHAHGCDPRRTRQRGHREHRYDGVAAGAAEQESHTGGVADRRRPGGVWTTARPGDVPCASFNRVPRRAPRLLSRSPPESAAETLCSSGTVTHAGDRGRCAPA